MKSLNGAQITAMLSIISQLNLGQIDRDQAVEIIMTLGVSKDQAEKILRENV